MQQSSNPAQEPKTLFDSCESDSNKKSNPDHIPHLTEYLRVFFETSPRINPADISITFYPYSRLNNTIRFIDNRVLIRLSDILVEAPLEVLSVLVILLGCKLIHSKPPAEYPLIYRTFILRPEIQKRVEMVRKERGSKRFSHPRGSNFDLDSLYRTLNDQYFESRIKIKQLGWSLKKARRTLGHYDPAHQTIIINRRLDNPLVPEYVVKYVVYHEMLHAFLGPITSSGLRRVHHSKFREMEKRFSSYKKAKKFISRYF